MRDLRIEGDELVLSFRGLRAFISNPGGFRIPLRSVRDVGRAEAFVPPWWRNIAHVGHARKLYVGVGWTFWSIDCLDRGVAVVTDRWWMKIAFIGVPDREGSIAEIRRAIGRTSDEAP